MRFFTNENKDDRDDARDDARDVDVRDRDEHPEAVSSDPVPVPQQRANSPWSSTPDTGDDATHDVAAVPATDRDAAGHRRDDDDTDGSNRVDEALDDRGTFDDPQVSDAAHAPSDTDADREADRLAGRHEDPTPPDHAVADTSSSTSSTSTSASSTSDDAGASTSEDAALKDDGGFDDPKAVDPETEKPLDNAGVAGVAVPATTGAAAAATATPGSAAPTSTTSASTTSASSTSATDSKPGEVEAPKVASLFGDDDANSFKDRLRDVQLRFVDSPKEAVAEAAGLVDEAVDKLTSALKAQKNQFGGESTEDTEKLRVELRGYRDILNRITGL